MGNAKSRTGDFQENVLADVDAQLKGKPSLLLVVCLVAKFPLIYLLSFLLITTLANVLSAILKALQNQNQKWVHWAKGVPTCKEFVLVVWHQTR